VDHGIDWRILDGLTERQLINRMLVACLIFSTITLLVTGILIWNKSETTAAQDISIDAGLEEISGSTDVLAESDCLVIPLPEGMTESDVVIEPEPLEKRVNLLINNVGEDFYYDNPLGGSGEQVEKILYGYENGSARIVLLMRGIYECEAEVSGRELKLMFSEPGDVFDTVVVLNPGHGSDVGTVAYGYDECTVDHRLADILAEVLRSEGLGVYVAEDEAAAEVAAELEADIFISLHCNGDTRTRTARGQSIEYVRDDLDGKKLSECIRTAIESNVDDSRVSIGIYDGSRAMPAGEASVRIMAGYLTNYEEAVRLNDEEYLKGLAAGLTEGIKEYLK